MTRILFLFSPFLFGGLCLLLGETINWLKQKRVEKGPAEATVVLHSGRK